MPIPLIVILSLAKVYSPFLESSLTSAAVLLATRQHVLAFQFRRLAFLLVLVLAARPTHPSNPSPSAIAAVVFIECSLDDRRPVRGLSCAQPRRELYAPSLSNGADSSGQPADSAASAVAMNKSRDLMSEARSRLGGVRHTHRRELLVQPVVAAIPLASGRAREPDVRRPVVAVDVEDRGVLPGLFAARVQSSSGVPRPWCSWKSNAPSRLATIGNRSGCRSPSRTAPCPPIPTPATATARRPIFQVDSIQGTT